MATVAVPAPQVTSWSRPESRGVTVSSTHAKAVAIVLTTMVALGARTSMLSTYGLSEDETHKVQAIEEYRSGRFSANAEHPMLMKLAMWGSLEVRDAWNHVAPPSRTLSLETALRLPNAVAGSLTTAALFGVADLLFGTPAAVLASAFWALDVNAIAVARIGKEDTFLLFFFLGAVWCYERGKRQGAADPLGAQRWYTLSGLSFGLMLASKYFPHYLGIYSLFNAITDRQPGANRPDKRLFYGAMTAAFLAANFAVLMPETWRYVARYLQGGMLPHHGYLYAGRLYVTNIPLSPLGLPVTYYLRFIATKVPLPLLALAGVGLLELARRRDQRGYVLLRVLLLFIIVPYSLMAAKFLRYTLPMLLTIDATAAVGLVALLRAVWESRRLSGLESAALTASMVMLPLVTVAATTRVAPFYSLYENALGERLAAPGTVFSEETYEFGVREAVAAIAEAAAPSAVIVSDAPGVVDQYLKEAGRGDIGVRSLSGDGIPVRSSADAWVIVQDEHISFENDSVVQQLRRTSPWREFRAGDVIAAQVFRIQGG